VASGKYGKTIIREIVKNFPAAAKNEKNTGNNIFVVFIKGKNGIQSI